MSAPNFYSRNTSAIYAVDDEQAEYIDDIKANVLEQLRADGLDVDDIDALSTDDNSTYGGWCFGLVTGNYGKNNTNYPAIELVTRGGYYSGLNLDYVITYMVDNEEYAEEYLEGAYVYDGRTGDYKDISKTEVKRLQANARKLCKKIDKAMAANTNSLRKVAQFSNGEAVYERS